MMIINIIPLFSDNIYVILAISLLLNLFYLYRQYGDYLLPGKMKRRNFYLCPHFQGGLGNLMFQFASVYGIATAKGMNVALFPFNDINRTFNLSMHFIRNRTVCREAKIVREKKSCMFDSAARNFTSGHNYLLQKSYLQSWKYFSNVEQNLRKQFVFTGDVRYKAQNIIREALTAFNAKSENAENVTFIGVHVRRGDMVKRNNVNYGYLTAPKEYLEKAMDYFRKKIKRTLFLIFTNPNDADRKWCQNNIKGNDVMLMDKRPREIDMCTMANCNHTIMTVGSFGWWSSWLANGTTIYYKNVAKPGSKLREEFSKDMSDYFYPGWIGFT